MPEPQTCRKRLRREPGSAVARPPAYDSVSSVQTCCKSPEVALVDDGAALDVEAAAAAGS